MTETQITPMGDVIGEGEHAILIFERHLHHPPETVWEAITDPSQLREWYMTRAQIEGRVGGRIEFWAGPSQFHVTGTILAWDPPRVFEHEWNVEPRPELPKGEHAVIRWEIVPQGDDALLKFTHRHLTRQAAQGFASGAHAFLDRLEARLAGKPMPDFRKRVEELRSSYHQRTRN